MNPEEREKRLEVCNKLKEKVGSYFFLKNKIIYSKFLTFRSRLQNWNLV